MYYLLLTANLQAQEKYFYDSNEIAPISQTFVDAQSQLFPKYEALEKDITKYEVGMKKMETMMLVSDSSDGSLYAQYLKQKKHFIGTKIQFQTRSEGTINGYGEVFMSAVQKEVQSNWSGAVECSEKQSLIMGMQLNKDSDECEGRNISKELAIAIDKDPQLKEQITQINAEPWPNISIPNLQQSLGGDYIYLSVIVEYFYKEELSYQKDFRRQEIDKLNPKLQSENEEEKKDGILQAELINQNYRDALLSYGQQIQMALTKIGKNETAICFTPKEFGGCSGKNISSDVIDTLENTRKAYKIIKKKKN